MGWAYKRDENRAKKCPDCDSEKIGYDAYLPDLNDEDSRKWAEKHAHEDGRCHEKECRARWSSPLTVVETNRDTCPNCLSDEHAEVENYNRTWGDGDLVCMKCKVKIRDIDTG